MTPFFQKLIAFLAAIVAIIVAFTFVEDPTARTVVVALAVGLAGAVGIRRPGDRPSAAALLLVPMLALSGCAGAWENVNWADTVACGVPDSNVMGKARDVFRYEADNGPGLSSGGKKRLGGLAVQYGSEAVLCAAQSLLSKLTAVAMSSGEHVPLDPANEGEVEAIEAFLQAAGDPEFQ